MDTKKIRQTEELRTMTSQASLEPNRIIEAVQDAAKDLHSAGLIDDARMEHYGVAVTRSAEDKKTSPRSSLRRSTGRF